MAEPLYTRPANWNDVVDLAARLHRHGVRYVLVGGYALAAHGFTRMTIDIDIAVAPDEDNSRRWVAALSELPDAAARELTGEDDPFRGDLLHALRINDEITIDFSKNPSSARVRSARRGESRAQAVSSRKLG